MDDRWLKNQADNHLSSGKKMPLPQDEDGVLSPPPAVSPATKETEKVVAIKKELEKEALREAREVEPRIEEVEVKEISLEDKVELPEDLRKMGVEALVPPVVPEELQPQAEVVTLATTKIEAEGGASQPLANSFRWLYTLLDRLVKKMGGGFRYVFRNLGTQKARG